MPERLKGADCKSAGVRLRGFESLSHQLNFYQPSLVESAVEAAHRGLGMVKGHWVSRSGEPIEEP